MESAWNVIQHRVDTAYLFVVSLLTLATIYGQHFLDDDPSTARDDSSLPLTLHTFAAASEFLSGDQWSWIQNTSQWLTVRSEVLHPAAVFSLLGAGIVIGLQGSGSLQTKTSATLLLGWVLVVNTGGMSSDNWAQLIVLSVGAALMIHLWKGVTVCGEEISMAIVSVVVSALYSVFFVVNWLIGKTRSRKGGPTVAAIN